MLNNKILQYDQITINKAESYSLLTAQQRSMFPILQICL